MSELAFAPPLIEPIVSIALAKVGRKFCQVGSWTHRRASLREDTRVGQTRESDPKRLHAALIRPAVMFGPDDAFLTTILGRFGLFLLIRCSASAELKLSWLMWKDAAEVIARGLERDGIRR